jgi:hypothetical protein
LQGKTQEIATKHLIFYISTPFLLFYHKIKATFHSQIFFKENAPLFELTKGIFGDEKSIMFKQKK